MNTQIQNVRRHPIEKKNPSTPTPRIQPCSRSKCEGHVKLKNEYFRGKKFKKGKEKSKKTAVSMMHQKNHTVGVVGHPVRLRPRARLEGGIGEATPRLHRPPRRQGGNTAESKKYCQLSKKRNELCINNRTKKDARSVIAKHM